MFNISKFYAVIHFLCRHKQNREFSKKQIIFTTATLTEVGAREVLAHFSFYSILENLDKSCLFPITTNKSRS